MHIYLGWSEHKLIKQVQRFDSNMAQMSQPDYKNCDSYPIQLINGLG